jgi:hypothetical protein
MSYEQLGGLLAFGIYLVVKYRHRIRRLFP